MSICLQSQHEQQALSREPRSGSQAAIHRKKLLVMGAKAKLQAREWQRSATATDSTPISSERQCTRAARTKGARSLHRFATDSGTKWGAGRSHVYGCLPTHKMTRGQSRASKHSMGAHVSLLEHEQSCHGTGGTRRASRLPRHLEHQVVNVCPHCLYLPAAEA
jgi:hypothetical protein